LADEAGRPAPINRTAESRQNKGPSLNNGY
jgi:hypothetical protein